MKITRRLSAFLLLMLIGVATLSSLLLGFLWISNEFSAFKSQSDDLRTSLIEQKKLFLKQHIDSLMDYLEYKRAQTETRLKVEIRSRVHEACAIAEHLYQQYRLTHGDEEIAAMIREALRPIRFHNGQGYYFATDMAGVEQLFADRPALEGQNLFDMQDANGEYVIRDMIRIVREQGEGFYQYAWTKPLSQGVEYPKLSYIKYFPPLDWLIGTGGYLDEMETQIQQEVLDRLANIRIGQDGYVFAGRWDGIKLTEPEAGANVYDQEDPHGVKIYQELIAVAKRGGGYVQYMMPKAAGSVPMPKLSYAAGITAWRWYVGTGVYIDEIDALIKLKQRELHQLVVAKIIRILIALGFLLGVVFIVAALISSRIKKNFRIFSDFFQQAAEKFTMVNPEQIHFAEFSDLAQTMNFMVSERNRMLESLKASEARYKGVFNYTQNGIAVYQAVNDGEDFIIIDINKRAELIDQVRREEIIGKSVITSFPGIKEFNLFSTFQNVWRTGEAEYHPVGLYQDQRIAGWRENFVYKLPSGEVVAMYSDETERMKSMESLRRSEDKYRRVTESASDAIILTDLSGSIVGWNKAATTLFGYDEAEAMGKSLSLLTPDTEQAEAQTIIETVNADGVINIREIEGKRKDGALINLEINAAALKDANETITGSCAIIRDITERKRAESEQKKRDLQLRQIQKLEAIGTLAGGIAHDFNNILFPIVGYAELAIDDVPADSLLREYLEEIYKASLRARDLIQQILTFSRETEREYYPLKLQPIIKEVLKLMRSTLPATIEIREQIDATAGLVNADPTQIHQIIMNLCTNAYQAMRETGGVLKVELNEIELEAEDIVAMTQLSPGAFVRLTISDTGEGMNEYVMERIFEPFYSTKQEKGGSGLGLSIVHGIIRDMHGHITVYSQPGQGAAFRIYFPQIIANPELLEAIADEPISAGSERVLLVDDQPGVAKVIQHQLEKIGHQVTVMTNSLEALHLFKNAPHEFDLVITDMTMPNMTGAELSRHILHIRPNTPIILCTGFSDLISEEKSKEMGIKAFVMKPVIKKDLVNAIRTARE